MKKSKLMLYDCDRCKFTFRKHTLKKQRGMFLCSACYDSVLEIAPVNLRLRSPRDASTTTDPVTIPVVFSVASAGINAIGYSQVPTREGTSLNHLMYVSGGSSPVQISSIVPAVDKHVLTLVGTSDINYVIVRGGLQSTVDLMGTDDGVILYDGSVLILVYNSTTGKWMEASRFRVGIYVALPDVPVPGETMFVVDENGNYVVDENGNYVVA